MAEPHDPEILPTIGMTGVYTLLPPFHSLQSTQQRLTCIAVRTLRDYLSDGGNPLNDLYIARGLTEAEYAAAVVRNQPVITLQADTGYRLDVPTNYIARYPDSNGVPYATYILATNIGPLPLGTDLTGLIEALSDAIYDTLGATPDVQPVVASHTVLISHDDHTAVLAARNARRTQILSNAARCQQLQVELTQLRTLYSELEAYVIEQHLPPDTP